MGRSRDLSNLAGAGAVGTTNIADNAVTTAKIAAGAVATSDIADGNVTGAKLENSGVTAGSYGSASSVPTITLDAKGRATSAASTAIAISSAQVSGLAASATTDTTNAANIIAGTLPAGRLPALTGDVTTTVGTAATTLANSGVTAGTYGSSSAVPVVTVDAKGRITSATTAALSSGVPATYGAIGTVAGLYLSSTTNILPGGTASGSNLFYATNTQGNSGIVSGNLNQNSFDPRNRTTAFTIWNVNLSPIGSGTWRLISAHYCFGAMYQNDGYGNFLGGIYCALWQRIA